MNNEQMREDFEEHLTRNVSGLCTYQTAISKNPNGDYISKFSQERWIDWQAMTKAKYIQVQAKVRYWEDAAINGVADETGTLIPMRDGTMWQPVIRLVDGVVMDWPKGTTADIYYKVCDAGEYWLLDDARNRVAKWAGSYVPSEFLCHGDDGYGDYIIFVVGVDGCIAKWREPEITISGSDDDQSGWTLLAGKDIEP